MQDANRAVAYSAISNSTFDHDLAFRVYRYLAGTIDHSITDDGLGIDRKRRWSFVCFHSLSCRHDCDPKLCGPKLKVDENGIGRAAEQQ